MFERTVKKTCDLERIGSDSILHYGPAKGTVCVTDCGMVCGSVSEMLAPVAAPEDDTDDAVAPSLLDPSL